MADISVKQQFDAVVARSGLRIPEDREVTMFRSFENVLKWSEMVRNRPRPPAHEPSNAFFLETVTRVIGTR